MVLATNRGYDPFRLYQYFRDQQDPASAIASGLGGAQRNDPAMGGTAQDNGDPWGVYRANTRPEVLYQDGSGPAPQGAQGNWESWYGDDMGKWGGSQWNGSQWINTGAQIGAGSALGKTGARASVNYNAAGDRFLHEYNGNPEETSWTRINRWASDGQKLKGLSAQDAYNAALARLKRDMGNNWQASGFDLSGVQAAPVGQDFYIPQIAAQGQDQGTPLGLGQRSTPTLQGEFTPAPQAAGQTTNQGQQGGTMSVGGYTTAGAPQQASGALGHTAVTSGGQPSMMGNGSFSLGQYQFGDLDRVIAQAKGNPALAAQLLRMAQGQTGRVTSTIGKYMDNYYGKALQAVLAQAGNVTAPGGGSGNALNDMLQGFFNAQQSGSIVPFAQNIAQQALNADYSGMDDADVQAALAGANALGSLGLGDVAGSRNDSRLQDLLYQLNADTMGSGQYDTGGRLAQLLKGSPYQKAMAQFAATR